MYICPNAISSWKLWILGVRFKGQPSAQWLFKKLCRIDGIEKKKKEEQEQEEGNYKVSVVHVLVIPRVTILFLGASLIL